MGAFAGPEIAESGLVLALDAANKKSYSQNEFQYSTDIVTFSGTGANAATITRDTISSPVGNTPLKMVVTGNDPYVSSMYNAPSDNIAPAANGQTWIVSVYIKANVSTTGAIFIFGAAADGNVFDAVTGQIAAGGVSIGTDWTRVSYAFTFTKGISFIQVRLDGPETGGTGQTLWWDGLQVERVPSGTTTPTPFTSSYYGGSVYRDLVGSNNGTLVNYPTYSGSNSGSLSFDGTNDYVNFTSDSNLLPTAGLTVSVWFKSSVVHSPTLVDKSTGESSTSGYRMIGTISGGIQAYVNGIFVSTPSSVTTGNWINLVFTWTPSTSLILYQNSSQVSINTTSIPASITNPSRIVRIAARNTTPTISEYFNGNISQVSIYNRALTAQEIQQNFIATRSRFSI